MKLCRFLGLLLLVVLITGCKDTDVSYEIMGNTNKIVVAGDEIPDLLDGVTMGVLEEDSDYMLQVDTSNVDTSIAGTYEITYYIEHNGTRVYEESNTIHVLLQDVSYEIVGNTNKNLFVGDEVPDLLNGVTMGMLEEDSDYMLQVDASNIVTSIAGTYEITYYIMHDGTRVYEESNTIRVLQQDVSPFPVITGVSDITYVIGEELPDFFDGVTAYDPEYGDITPYIEVSTDVQYDTLGTYEVTYAVMNNDGYRVTVPSVIDVIGGELYEDLPDDFFIVVTNEKWGMIDPSNEFIIPAIYDSITYLKESLVRLSVDETYMYYDFENNEYFQSEYVIYGLYYNGLGVAMNSEGYLGYVDHRGEMVLPFIYDGVGPFDDDGAIVTMGDNIGLIDASGNPIIDIAYQELGLFEDNLYKAVVGNETFLFDSSGAELFHCSSILNSVELNDQKYYYYSDSPTQDTVGLINVNGDIIVESIYQTLTYMGPNVLAYTVDTDIYDVYNLESGNILYDIDDIMEYEEDLRVRISSLYGLYDFDTLEELIPIAYKSISKYEDIVFIRSEEDLYGMTDENYVVTVPPIYQTAGGYKNGVAIFRDANGYHLITKQGVEVTQTDYSLIMLSTSTDYYRFRDDLGLWGFIDENGVEVLPATYDALLEYDDYGYLYVRNTEDLWGVIDRDFNEVLPTMYNSISAYSEGYFAVKLSAIDDTSSGHVDATNTIITPLIYRHANSFINGASIVKITDTERNFVDTTGNLISSTNFTAVRNFSDNGLTSVKTTSSDNSWCVMDLNGDYIGSCIYNYIGSFSDGYAVVLLNNGYYNYIKEDGTLLNYDIYSYTREFEHGVGVITNSSSMYAFNVEGELILGNKDQITVSLDGNSILVRDDNYYGFYALDGSMIIPEIYKQVSQMVYGHALTCEEVGTDCGFTTNENKTVIPHRYTLQNYISMYSMIIRIDDELYDIEIMEEGLYKGIRYNGETFMYTIISDGIWSLYNMNDEMIGQYEVDDIREYNEEYLLYEIDGRFGSISLDTGIMSDTYHQVNISEYPYWYVWDNGNQGLIKEDGLEIIEAVYDGLVYNPDLDYIRAINGNFEGIYSIEGILIIPIEYDFVKIEKK